MSKFWELLEESVLIQGVMALAMLGAIIFLAVQGREIPDILTNGFFAIIGFYFGSKTTVEAKKLISPPK